MTTERHNDARATGISGTVTTEIKVDGAAYTVEIGIDADARVESVKVTSAPGGPPVTGTVFRALRLQELQRAALARALHGRGGMPALLETLTAEEAELTRLRGPVPSSLETTGRIYTAAVVSRLDPAKQVETVLKMPRSTAIRWIRLSKDAGYISPAVAAAGQTMRSGRPRRLPAGE